MKLINVNTNVVLTLVAAAVIATSVPALAEENGFTLEDSIRNQIFMELKSNVENLYQNGRLVVPAIDISTAARVVSRDPSKVFTLPTNSNLNTTNKETTVNNIN